MNQGFGKQYEVPERLGGMPKTTETAPATTTTPGETEAATLARLQAEADARTKADADARTKAEAEAQRLATAERERLAASEKSRLEAELAAIQNARGAFSTGGVGNIKLGKQKGKGRKGMPKTRTSASKGTPKLTNIGTR